MSGDSGLLTAGAGAQSDRATPRGGDGAAFYSAYMSQLQGNTHRPLRKQRSPPPSDAAGLLYGARFHGRDVPSKKHVSQERTQEPNFALTGRSHTTVRELMDAAEAAGVPSPGPGAGGRSVRKMVQTMSFKGAMAGPGLSITEEPEQPRAIQKCGTFKPTRNTARVLLTDRDGDAGGDDTNRVHDGAAGRWGPEAAAAAAEAGEQLHATSNRLVSWDDQVALCAAHDAETAAARRPGSAPPWATDDDNAGRRPLSAAQRTYQAGMRGSVDVFHYRFSGGVCPEDYKFSAEGHTRTPAPTAPPPESAVSMFAERRAEYTCNRVRALQSAPIY